MVKKRNVKKRENIKKRKKKRQSSSSQSSNSLSFNSNDNSNYQNIVEKKEEVKTKNIIKAKEMERIISHWNNEQDRKRNYDAVWIPEEMRSVQLHASKDRVFILGYNGHDGDGGYKYLVADFDKNIIYEETYNVTSNRTVKRNPRKTYSKELTILRKVLGKDLQGLTVYSGKEKYSYD